MSRQQQQSWTEEAIRKKLEGSGVEYVGEAPRHPKVRMAIIKCRCGDIRTVRLPAVVNLQKPPLCRGCGIRSRVLSQEVNGEKICTSCKKLKFLSCFYKKPSKIRYEARCRECQSTEQRILKDRLGREEVRNRERAHRAAHRERYRIYKKKSHLREKGLTYEEWQKMIADQGNRCAICGNLPGPQDKNVLHVDHCHKSGAIRGLLCHFCNTGLGSFKDNEELFFKAVEYLRRVPVKS